MPDEASDQSDSNSVARVRTELIIFDCDGVLVDSELISARVQADALNAAGVDIDEAALRSRFTGIPDRDMYRIIEAETGIRLPDSHDADVSAAIRASYDRELREIPGVEAAVRRLSLPRCVASSAAPDKLRHGLKVTGLWHLFAPHVFSASMVARGKPAPDLFLHAAKKMRAAPVATIVIEDSVAGVTAGVRAGMTVIGFSGGSHCDATTADALKAAGADVVVASMRDLGDAVRTASR